MMASNGLASNYPIRTARLDLRPHTRDDLDDLYAFHSRPDVVRYTPWPVRDREATREALEVKLGQGRLTSEGQWLVLAMVLRSTGTVIGEVLLKWVSIEDRQGEIGFALHDDFHGAGLAREAAEAVLRIGFDDLGLHRIFARCVSDNTASARLLERLGMRHEGHLIHGLRWKGTWADESIYAMLDDEWHGRDDSHCPPSP
jgi:RimJ/RimL family protein N-acetyltransferase